MDAITEFFGDIPAETWHVILAGTGVSGLLQALKTWLNLRSDKVIMFLLFALSFLTGVVEYLNEGAAQNPEVLGQYTAVIVGVATYAYRYIVKPFQTLVTDAQNYREQGQQRVEEVAPPVDEPEFDEMVPGTYDEPEELDELPDEVIEEFIDIQDQSLSNEGQDEPAPAKF